MARKVPKPDLDLFGVVTANRPAALKRVLESYAANFREHGRKPECFIVDDSRDAATRRSCRETLATTARGFPELDFSYWGAEEKSKWADDLARRSGVARSTIDFAIGDPFRTGYTPGANRNALTLLSAGRMIVSVDDDTLCRIRRPRGDSTAIRITERGESTRVWVQGSFSELTAAYPEISEDFLGLHAKTLGRKVSDIVGETPKSNLFVEPISEGFQASILSGASVRLGWTGIAGDCGYAKPGYLLFLGGEERARFLTGESEYEAYLRGRQIVRVTDETTLTPGGVFQSTAIAMDGREILPPFMPVFRGEDMAFGILFRTALRGAAVAYHSFTVDHLPIESRGHARSDLWSTMSESNFLDTASVFLAQIPFRPELSSEDAIATAGEDLRNRVDIGESDFRAFFEEMRRKSIDGRIEWFEGLLVRHGSEPRYWADDLSRFIAEFRKSGESTEKMVPFELRSGADVTGALRNVQRLMVEFARLLEAWPTLVKYARGS